MLMLSISGLWPSVGEAPPRRVAEWMEERTRLWSKSHSDFWRLSSELAEEREDRRRLRVKWQEPVWDFKPESAGQIRGLAAGQAWVLLLLITGCVKMEEFLKKLSIGFKALGRSTGMQPHPKREGSWKVWLTIYTKFQELRKGEQKFMCERCIEL